MKIGILGTGNVGKTIGTKLVQLGHQVKMGSRTPNNEKAAEFVKTNGDQASQGTFADAAAVGEIIFNCTQGAITMDVIKMVEGKLNGKILIDLSNPLDFSKGMPPVLIPSLSNTTSLGEEIQKAFPAVKVVKTLNTMNCAIMVNAAAVAGEHDVFMSGNDVDAKNKVKEILNSFGWKSPIDLGDITSARGAEQLLPIWLRLYGVFKSANFNFKIVK
jgi:predicted dinucleotide-binding enzyme